LSSTNPRLRPRRLLGAALAAEPAELWSYIFPAASRPFKAFPERLMALAGQPDAVVLTEEMRPAGDLSKVG